MSRRLNAKIRVMRPGTTGEVASLSPETLSPSDLENIANVTNLVVINLQNKLNTDEESKDPNKLALTEVEMAFGIDLEVGVKGGLTIPIIGPIINGSAKAGATFEVHVKLTRGSSL
jgi:hypothetical protein